MSVKLKSQFISSASYRTRCWQERVLALSELLWRLYSLLLPRIELLHPSLHILRLLHDIQLPFIFALLSLAFATDPYLSQFDKHLVSVQEHSLEYFDRLHMHDRVLLICFVIFQFDQIVRICFMLDQVNDLVFRFLKRVFLLCPQNFICDCR